MNQSLSLKAPASGIHEGAAKAEPDGPDGPLTQPWYGMTLATLLRSCALVQPGAIAFAEAGGADRPDISPTALDYGSAGLAMDGLRLRLTGLGAGPGDTVAVVMPNRIEAMVAILGLLEAGIRPLLMPASLPPDALWAALAASSACGLLVCGDGPGADLSADLVRAARAQRCLRFVAAFGDSAPPGSVPLGGFYDLQILGQITDPSDRHGAARISILTVELLDGVRPIEHPQEALVAGALHVALTAGIVSGDPILTTLPAATQAGLITGLAAALVTGSPLHALPVFSSTALQGALAAIGLCHLIAPSLLEHPLAAEGLLGSSRLRSTLLLHRAPADLSSPVTGSELGSPVIDVLALGERATLSGLRGYGGRSSLARGSFGLGGLPEVDPVALLEVDERGAPCLQGAAIGRPPRDEAHAPQRIENLTLRLSEDGHILAVATNRAG